MGFGDLGDGKVMLYIYSIILKVLEVVCWVVPPIIILVLTGILGRGDLSPCSCTCFLNWWNLEIYN